jgi:uncharacterized protein
MKISNFFLPLLVLVSSAAGSQENRKSLLWEISGNGLKRASYLYGTMHTADNRVFEFKDGVMEAFEACETLALELDIGGIIRQDIFQKLIMDSNLTIQSLLPSEDYKLLSEFFRDSLKQNILLFNKMQPLFVAGLVSQRHLKNDRKEALDLYFYSLAKERNKEIAGLETMEEQIATFRSVPYQKQAETLLDAVKNSSSNEREAKDILQYYIAGDLDKLLEMTTEMEIAGEFKDAFLTRRNRNMTYRAEALMIEKPVFIAVGAAHLAGDEGIIALLRKRGYSVEAK